MTEKQPKEDILAHEIRHRELSLEESLTLSVV